ncbi:galactose oxidase-like protein precursor [Elsinoe ampelina]|uniref:Galactose oxidase-like protein n=1 Tax=Elsinoe ampelina TaxID=302913 RepID=A0A6A6G1K5_9PEZI|nr:galactose oxidase-like protein precursor [Elsinoe ampelina]
MAAFFVPLLLASGCFVTANAQRITACPTTANRVTAADGAIYEICSGTDYRGPSAQILPNIGSNTLCLDRCAVTTGCTQAVYHAAAQTCHLKGNPQQLEWWVDPIFDTIRQIQGVQQGSVITTCPYDEVLTTTADGSEYAICPGTDYEAYSYEVGQNVQTVGDCLSRCATNNGCSRAVYDNTGKVCHIKGTRTDLRWTINRQFSIIRQVSKVKAVPVAPTDRIKVGVWSDLIKLPIIPVAAYVVPEGPTANRMLFFSAYGSTDFGNDYGYTQFAELNYVTGAVSQREIANTQHDMFCPGISMLQDGRIVITGGSSAAVVSIYDPKTNAFTRAANMKLGRGYQTSATLSDGRIFTIGGSFTGGLGGKVGEVFNATTNTWTLLSQADVQPMLTTDAEGIWREDNHAWLFGWTNGSVFQGGPSKAMNWYGTTGTGRTVAAGTRDTVDAMCAIYVLFDAAQGKILSAGGSQDYTNSPGFTRAHITTITRPFVAPTVERVPDMAFPRGYANAVVLPDGTVLVTGGMRRSMVFSDWNSVLTPELFDPKTKTWKSMADEGVPRNYHSVSLLLSDGRVFSGGGGLCAVGRGASDAHCDRSVDHADGQIFSPPYLFNEDGSEAVRPRVVSVAASGSTAGEKIRVGGTLTVEMGDQGTYAFALLRMGSVTHSVNSDQRRLPVSGTRSGTRWSIRLPTDSGVVLPGFWYLFAVNGRGTPSVARTLQITL